MTEKKQELQKTQNREGTHDRPVYVPATDIFEQGDEIVVLADMPGVDSERTDVHLENGVLTITGCAEPVTETTEGFELVRSEYAPGDYKRSFEVLEDIDVEKIRAKMNNGVLRVVLPKAERVKPRKIKVEA